MLFNKQQIESSIVINENLWLYEIKLPWIKRYFESIYYSFEWNNKLYWELASKFNKINFGNKLVWISRFNNYYITCLIDLKNLESEYFFVEVFDVFEINLDWKKSSIFIYKDYESKIWYFTDYEWKDFTFRIISKSFIVKNSIFDTEILHINFKLDNILNNEKIELIKEDKKAYLDIIDFFIYDDFFIKSNNNNFDNFNDFLEKINNNFVKINTDLNIKTKITKYSDLYYPKIKINFSILTKNIINFELKEFRKLLLSFFAENISCYIINNKFIQEYFREYFRDFTKIEFDEINLDFDIPDNIYISDKLFEKFKLDLLKLRYNLFLLKESYKSKNKIAKWDSEYIKLTNSRLKLNKNSLEKIISNYEKILSKLLEKIK